MKKPAHEKQSIKFAGAVEVSPTPGLECGEGRLCVMKTSCSSRQGGGRWSQDDLQICNYRNNAICCPVSDAIDPGSRKQQNAARRQANRKQQSQRQQTNKQVGSRVHLTVGDHFKRGSGPVTEVNEKFQSLADQRLHLQRQQVNRQKNRT